MNIVVTKVQMGSVAGFIRGYITIDNLKVNFVGTAYGRFSGQNVNVKFSPAAKKKMIANGLDPEEVALEAQTSIVSGFFEIENARLDDESTDHA